MLPSDLEQAVEQDHRALNEVVKGNPELKKKMLSRRDDVTLANPVGPAARGWEQVEKAMERAVSQLREGEPLDFERISDYATADLAYTVEYERGRMKVGGSDEMVPVSLRVTQIWRREDEGWKIVHRHADPITSPRPIESILER